MWETYGYQYVAIYSHQTFPEEAGVVEIGEANTTGGHRTRVVAVTLDNMAEDAVAASASLQQIITVSSRYCGPAFVSWLSMLWDTLMRNSE